MKLPKIFQPKHDFELRRLGSQNDGGYLVGKNSVNESEYLISFGIESNWDFEKDFKKFNNKIKIQCYDFQTNFNYLIRLLLKALIKLEIINFYLLLIRIFDYFIFFKNIPLINKFISKIEHFDDAINNKNNVFVKIDIEGSEYRILDSIIKNKEKLIGLVIEFHDVDVNIEKIENFIKNMNLELIHIHANNFIYDANNWKNNFNYPPCLELTFEKKPIIKNVNYYQPNVLDRPNSKHAKEISLEFLKF